MVIYYIIGMKHSDKRKISHSAKEALRYQAVRMIVKQGVSVMVTSKMLNVSRTALYKWLDIYHEQGFQGLKAQKLGRPPSSRISQEEAKMIRKKITDKCPEQLKLPFMLWTLEAVKQLILRLCGVTVSVTTVGRYLKKWGFSPQKPIVKAYEQDPKEIKKWLEDEYPAIMRSAKCVGAIIHWGDQTGLRSDHQAGRTYGRKGRTPVIRKSGKRFRSNMMSSLTNRGHLEFMIYRKKFNSQVFIRFMKRLIKGKKQKIYFIVDRHPTHKTKVVKEWIKENSKTIKLFYLPAYSPELNPDEMVNNDLKTNVIGKKRPANVEEMERWTKNFMNRRRKNPEQVKKYFHKDTVRYASADYNFVNH